jgi:hypothetical protein
MAKNQYSYSGNPKVSRDHHRGLFLPYIINSIQDEIEIVEKAFIEKVNEVDNGFVSINENLESLMGSKEVSIFIPPKNIVKVGGTWSTAFENNLLCEKRAVGAGDFQLYIPIAPIAKSIGAELIDISFWFKISGDWIDFLTGAYYKTTLTEDASPVLGEAKSDITFDQAHSNPLSSSDIGDHKLTMTFSNPIKVVNNVTYTPCLIVNGTNGATFILYGAVLNFKL